jgi:hypothetical protein
MAMLVTVTIPWVKQALLITYLAIWRLVNPLGACYIKARTRRQLILLARLVWPPVCFAMCTMINPSALPNPTRLHNHLHQFDIDCTYASV